MISSNLTTLPCSYHDTYGTCPVVVSVCRNGRTYTFLALIHTGTILTTEYSRQMAKLSPSFGAIVRDPTAIEPKPLVFQYAVAVSDRIPWILAHGISPMEFMRGVLGPLPMCCIVLRKVGSRS
jgi:hypothetical protein